MKYIFYNIETEEKGKLRDLPYTIDGQPALHSDNKFIELEVIEKPQPTIEEGFYLVKKEIINLENKTLTISYDIIKETEEQTKIRELLKLELIKQKKLLELEVQYNTTLKQGITPQGTNFSLAAEEKDKASFAQLVALLREYEELQSTPEAREAFKASPVTISDKDGNMIELTVTQFRAAIISYGFQINTLWGTFSAKKAAVASATTIEEVNAIE